MRSRSSGFTLIEVLVALFLMALGALAAAPLFMHALHGNAAAGSLGQVATAAEQRMELLRERSYAGLAPGGSLTSDSAGYFDYPRADLSVRWSIANATSPPGTKVVSVRARVLGDGPTPAKEITLIMLRGD